MMRSAIAILALCVSSSLFAAGHDLPASPTTSDQNLPVVTGNGAGFTAAWTESTHERAVMSLGVSGSGEPAGAGSAIGVRPAGSMAIAHSPFETLVVFHDGNVSAVRLSPSGAVLNTILLWSGSAFQSLEVAVAWNGSRYFVIWSDSHQLTGAFISPGGSSTQPRAFLTEPDFSKQLTHPEVAWNGQHFIVVAGEKLTPDCSCPPPTTSQIRVMRVSADGDAVDASPVIISGSHRRAHIASSGSESLITLDGPGGVSAIIARDGSALTLDAETPLFAWYLNISSVVAWNGSTYIVAWRYESAYGFLTGPGWLGAAQVTRAGLPFDYRVTAARSGFGLTTYVCIAANEAGNTALVTQEFAEGSTYIRARLYLASELAPMPPPPPAPTNVVSFVFGPYARIDWQATGADNGFVIEFSPDSGKQWTASYALPADARSATVTGTLGALYRIRALGPGGSSEGTITRIVSSERRRAERP
jgi:hypothetical protein